MTAEDIIKCHLEIKTHLVNLNNRVIDLETLGDINTLDDRDLLLLVILKNFIINYSVDRVREGLDRDVLSYSKYILGEEYKVNSVLDVNVVNSYDAVDILQLINTICNSNMFYNFQFLE